MNFFAWHNGTVSDPKFRVVARRSGVPVALVIAVWAAVLENANEPGGERGTVRGLDPEVIAAALDLEPEQVQAILAHMQGKTMDGERVTGWQNRNPRRDSSRERTRAYRGRQRMAGDESEVVVTGGDASRDEVTAGDALDYRREEEKNTPPTPLEGGTAGEGTLNGKRRSRKKPTTAEAEADPEWAQIREAYPRRAGSNPWGGAYTHFRAWREGRNGRTVSSFEEILAGTVRYAAFARATGKEGTERVMQAQRFFGSEGEWRADWGAPAEPAAAEDGFSRAAVRQAQEAEQQRKGAGEAAYLAARAAWESRVEPRWKALAGDDPVKVRIRADASQRTAALKPRAELHKVAFRTECLTAFGAEIGDPKPQESAAW